MRRAIRGPKAYKAGFLHSTIRWILYIERDIMSVSVERNWVIAIFVQHSLSKLTGKHMKSRPIPVIIVSVMFIIAGCVGFVYHLKDFFEPGAIWYEILWVEFVRILAIVCGIFLLIPINWAKWLAIAWLVYHVIIGAYHSTSQMISHLVLLLLVIVLLYLPISSAFFQKKKP